MGDDSVLWFDNTAKKWILHHAASPTLSFQLSHFSLTTLKDGAHGRGKAESQVCLWAVATTHGSGWRAPLFAAETGSDYNRFPNKLSYEEKHDCAGQSGGLCDSSRCARLGRG